MNITNNDAPIEFNVLNISKFVALYIVCKIDKIAIPIRVRDVPIEWIVVSNGFNLKDFKSQYIQPNSPNIIANKAAICMLANTKYVS